MSTRAGPLETILFDLDGTLIDSIELIFQSYEHALREHGYRVLSRAEMLVGLGTPLAAQFGALTDDAREIEALIATYRAYNLARHDELVKRYPGVLERVNSLARRGLTLGVVTSKRSDSARRGLELCGFDGLFTVVVALEDTTKHKPDPEPIRTALARLGADAANACYVGDSPHDLVAGRAAGVRVYAAGWGPFSKDAFAGVPMDGWLDQPDELTRLG